VERGSCGPVLSILRVSEDWGSLWAAAVSTLATSAARATLASRASRCLGPVGSLRSSEKPCFSNALSQDTVPL
jgi:hypothetical protein